MEVSCLHQTDAKPVRDCSPVSGNTLDSTPDVAFRNEVKLLQTKSVEPEKTANTILACQPPTRGIQKLPYVRTQTFDYAHTNLADISPSDIKRALVLSKNNSASQAEDQRRKQRDLEKRIGRKFGLLTSFILRNDLVTGSS